MSAASTPLLVAVDVGTSGARAVAVDLEGRVVAEVRRPYPTHIPRPGWAEQDPRDWEARALEALAGLARRVRRPAAVAGIGLTGQCPTIAAFDGRGRPIGPGMLYRDNRAVAEAAAMRERIGVQELHRRTGHVAEAFHAGPKILWLRANDRQAFAAARCFLQPRDVVLRRLTGRVATDQSHANATLFFDLRARAWAPELLAAFDLDPALFPEAVPPWAVVGGLEPAIARQVGLPAGVPVVAGAGDSQCAAFGAGVVDPGPVSEMAGSSSCLNSAVTDPVEDLRVTHYSHVVPDRYTTELGVNTTGAAVEWAVRRLGFGGFAELAGEAQRFRRRRRGSGTDPVEMAPLFLPYLGDGERDDPAVRAAFLGLSDRHDRPALAWAVLEGVAQALRATLAPLRAAGPVQGLRVAGGGGRLAVLAQLKADTLGVPVTRLEADTAATGAALLAAVAAGLAPRAQASIGALVTKAPIARPTAWWTEVADTRAAWFERVRHEPAVHDWRSR
jgi:sugar (pentulose or hexulose) kinase